MARRIVDFPVVPRGDGERAHDMFNNDVMHGLIDHLLNGGREFQIDASFGATADIAEMLLQRHHDEIKIWTDT